jgi:hypothetical protein
MAISFTDSHVLRSTCTELEGRTPRTFTSLRKKEKEIGMPGAVEAITRPEIPDRRMSTISQTTQAWNSNPLIANEDGIIATDLSSPEWSDGVPNVKTFSGVQLKVYLDRTAYTAPGIISGVVTLTVRSKVRIRNISVEVEGCEILHNEDKTTFLRKRLVLQGQGLPPTDVVDASMSDNQGYYKAMRKGTDFTFGIEIPQSPSSVAFKRCRIIYSVKR